MTPLILALALAGQPAPDPIDQLLYKSPILESEFLCASMVILRLEPTGEGQAPTAELQLLGTNKRKSRLDTFAFVPLVLKRIPASGDDTYSVSGIPADMVKPNQRVALGITKETARLTVSGRNGEMIRQVRLLFVASSGKTAKTLTKDSSR